MATLDELHTALRNADAAGDTAAATQLAAHIQTMRAAPPDKDTADAQRYQDDARARMKAEAHAAGQQSGNDMAMFLPNAAAGAIRGAGSIGATIVAPGDMLTDAMDGKGLSLESNRARRKGIDYFMRGAGADPDSTGYKGGKLTAEIAGTAGSGQVLAAPLRAAGMAPGFSQALATGGMRAGAPGGGAIANLGTRMAGGGLTGAAAASLANPDDIGTGASIGGMLPLGMLGAGKAGNMIGSLLGGKKMTPELQAQVAAARQAGYVIPPTQAKPSLMNRALEGFAGKITTAQNASARNQGVTNELAKKAIGATDLSPAGLMQVRQQANAAYDNLGQAGAFQSDQTFKSALDQAGASSASMRQNFPGLVNSDIDNMIAGLKANQQFDAQPTIEAIKQFRANAGVMKRSDDPAKVAMGRAQTKIAGALEDLIDRNLQRTGDTGLLDGYRAARQVLAKTHDVEKALNVGSGNVDAGKLGQALKKGRPLNGELKAIAQFASAFPKASQTVERMGSLPGISPLDFGAMGTISAATSNPAMMAGVLARPGARAMALSPMVQNRLLPKAAGRLEQMLQDERLRQLGYRAAPQQMGGD